MEIYLILINALALVLMCLDKQLARKKCRRIPESVLLTTAALGGAWGAAAGMWLARHKTQHWYFRYGLPLLASAHLYLLLGEK